jgi:hypothetical protein
MSYINTARKSRLTVNGVDESSRMISWEVNDDSLFKNGIMRTAGTVVLGTTSLTQYDYKREAYKRGQAVLMELWNSDISTYETHPRGLLYIISTSFSAENQQVTIGVGCKLSLWTISDDIDKMYTYSVIDIPEGQRTIQNISQGLYSSNKAIYQDNTGNIAEIDVFDLSFSPDDPNSIVSHWTTGSRTEALSASVLSGDELPDIVDLEYTFSSSEVFSSQEKIKTDTSSYDVGFNAITWVRDGSGPNLNSVENIDDSYSGLPGAAIGDYISVVNVEKVNTSRTETKTEYYNGPGGQVTRDVLDSYQPGLEVNAGYFEDKYSACRYQAALDGDADSTSCSYLQATSPMLASRIITTITYSEEGTVESRRRETWKPVLAAAQPFNWKQKDGEYGQPVNFEEVSLTDLYRDSVVITDYVQDDEGNNIETITTYTSGAVEYSAGIYASTGVVGTAELTVSEPVSYPNIQGTTSLDLATDTVSGSGAGMTVNVGWPTNTGTIAELNVTSSLTDCQWGVRVTGYSPGSWRPAAAVDDPSEVLENERQSALMYWGALPDTGVRKSGTWTGGSGSGFDGYIPTSSLPSIFSNVNYSNSRAALSPTWTISVSSTDFAVPSNQVISVLDGGQGYVVGDVITWTNNITPALQFGSKHASLGQALATDYGQSLNSTTMTAEVTSVNLIKPLITVASPGTGYNAGDQIRVTAAVLSANLGDTITEDLVFTIVSGENGITDLGEGIASLSLTDFSVGGGGGPADEYAQTSGTVRWDFRYDQADVYPTTITSTGGSDGTTGRFGSYDPDGEGVVDTPQIAPFFVRNKGLTIIDNGYIRSPAISTELIKTTFNVSTSTEFCWESWVFVESMSPKGMALCHWSTSSYPTTLNNWMSASSFQLELGWGMYIQNGNINVLSLEQDIGSAQDFAWPSGVLSVTYPQGEWFHVALTADLNTAGTSNDGRYNIYINGEFKGFSNRQETSLRSGSVYCYTGAGGFLESQVRSTLTPYVSVPPASNGDYLKVALSQTRFITGSTVYSSNFTPISTDPAPPSGISVVSGVYEGLEAVPVSGIGKAATVNLEIITGGSGEAGGTGWDPVLVSPALPYTEDIGTATATGGNGNGMILNLGVGYSGESYSGQSPVVIRSVADGGNGYQNGDILTVPATDMEGLLAPYGGGSVDNDLRFSVTPSQTADEAAGWLFPNVVGTQFAVGDTVKVTRTEVQAAAAGDPGQDISATVTAITPAKPMQNLTLDALDGGKRFVVNTSKTDSTLPDSPDRNATPSLPTTESGFDVIIRTDAYDPSFGGTPDSTKESLQVPAEYSSSTSDVSSFVEDYSRYLKNFVTGEAYGLRIGEAMRPEIMEYWTPVVGFRYTDERIGATFAMCADAASWGVSTQEAAVVYNGIWLGEVSYLVVTDETIDGGNFTTDVTLALDNDSYDGGDVTADTSIAINDDAISGGNFTTGNSGVEGYLGVGKVLAYRMELSFDSAQTFVLGSSTTDLPFSVDWEGDALTESIAANSPTHDYEEGTYNLGVYYDSGDNTNLINLSYSSYSTEALAIRGFHLTSNAATKANLNNFLRYAANLTSFTVSNDADFSSVRLFNNAFRDCSNLTSFPYFLTSTEGSFNSSWRECTSLKDFPPNFFDHIATATNSSPFTHAWNGCALSPESIQNILVSLDTMTLLPTDSPVTNINVGLNRGTNAAYSTWSTTAQAALTSLQAKGWNVLYNT